jgi:hypothetical protein
MQRWVGGLPPVVHHHRNRAAIARNELPATWTAPGPPGPLPAAAHGIAGWRSPQRTPPRYTARGGQRGRPQAALAAPRHRRRSQPRTQPKPQHRHPHPHRHRHPQKHCLRWPPQQQRGPQRPQCRRPPRPRRWLCCRPYPCLCRQTCLWRRRPCCYPCFPCRACAPPWRRCWCPPRTTQWSTVQSMRHLRVGRTANQRGIKQQRDTAHETLVVAATRVKRRRCAGRGAMVVGAGSCRMNQATHRLRPCCTPPT